MYTDSFKKYFWEPSLYSVLSAILPAMDTAEIDEDLSYAREYILERREENNKQVKATEGWYVT